MVAGLSEKEKATRLEPFKHFLQTDVQLLITQVHQQPVGEDEVDTGEKVK